MADGLYDDIEKMARVLALKHSWRDARCRIYRRLLLKHRHGQCLTSLTKHVRLAAWHVLRLLVAMMRRYLTFSMRAMSIRRRFLSSKHASDYIIRLPRDNASFQSTPNVAKAILHGHTIPDYPRWKSGEIIQFILND